MPFCLYGFLPPPRTSDLVKVDAVPCLLLANCLRTALMSRLTDIRAVEDFGSTIDQPKTSEIINGLSRLGIEKTEKVLVILDNPSDVIKKSINNIEKVKLIAADQLNVFDILNANKLIIGQSAINKIQEVYA